MNNPSFHGSRNAGAIGTYQRHCLSLHVGAHECAVCVVMLKEGNQRGRNAKYLRRQEVNVVDLAGRKLFREDFATFAALPGDNRLRSQMALPIDSSIAVGDRMMLLLLGVHIDHVLLVLATIRDSGIRRGDESELIKFGV